MTGPEPIGLITEDMMRKPHTKREEPRSGEALLMLPKVQALIAEYGGDITEVPFEKLAEATRESGE